MKALLARTFLSGKVVYGMPDRGTLYLTFDDGPHPERTPPVLDVLEAHGVKATFFNVGTELRAHEALAREVVARGHALANHSLTHPRMDRLSDSARRLEIERMDALLADFGASALPGLYRPPYGHASLGLVRLCLSMRRKIVMWSRDSFDFKYTADEVVAGFERQPPEGGQILLFHDDSAAAAPALARLIPRWQARGLRFDTLAALASAPN